MKIYASDLLPERILINVVVIGTGGTGAHLINRLVSVNETIIRLGYKGIKVWAFDGDKISSTNVGRQPFSHGQVDQMKCQTLIESINHVYGFQWEYFPVMFDSDATNNIGHWDDNEGIMISCVDNIAARRLIHKTPLFRHWMDIGNGRDFGQVIFGQFSDVVPKRRATHVFDVFPSMEDMIGSKEEQGPNCSVFEALAKQDLFINLHMATFAAGMIKDFICNLYLPYNQLYFNLGEMNINTV